MSAETGRTRSAKPVPIKFVIGSRVLASPRRQLITISHDLHTMLDKTPVPIPPLAAGEEGYRILSAPDSAIAAIRGNLKGFLFLRSQSYSRYYVDMRGGYESYLARFSSKTRSTLNRKSRKLAERSGGSLDIRAYRSRDEMAAFLAHALPLSALTYQERLLEAGLPGSPETIAEMHRLAEADRLRAFLMFVDGTAVSYLYLPIEGDVGREVLVYAFLGYHPEFAALSVGTVLQMEAFKLLFAENRFRYFDFTEGEGSHKALFGTDHVRGSTFVALRPNLANRALLLAYDTFDAAVTRASKFADRSGLKARIRKVLKK